MSEVSYPTDIASPPAAEVAPETACAEPVPPSTPPPALSVILLAHNEAAEVEEAAVGWLDYLQGLNRPFEVILVDDGGNDPAAIDRLAQRFHALQVIHHVASQGIGASLRAGLALAQQPLIFYTLCNKQYVPTDLGKLLEQIAEVQVVTGCRVGGKSPWWLRVVGLFHRVFCRVIFGLPIERRHSWLGWNTVGQRLVARWLFGLRFHDPGSTFCLFRREVFRRIPIQSDGSFAPVEILAKANFVVKEGTEVPVSFMPRRARRSFLQEAMTVFRHPEFGPAKLSEPVPQPVGAAAEAASIAEPSASPAEIPAKVDMPSANVGEIPPAANSPPPPMGNADKGSDTIQ